jgi:hypothetical protein
VQNAGGEIGRYCHGSYGCACYVDSGTGITKGATYRNGAETPAATAEGDLAEDRI